jgi:outer membrane cobalamin receptor
MNATLRATGSILAALALFGCASTSQSSKPAATAAADNPGCVTQTGSRIPSGKSDCVAAGRSYSSQDIDRTGATSAGAALRQMDPSITVHH